MCARITFYCVELTEFHKKLLKLKKKKNSHMTKNKFRQGKKINWIDYKKKTGKIKF